MSMSPSPGWYPDPTAPSMERWWDGARWTEHRRAAQAPVPPQQAAAPMGFGPPEPMPGASPSGRGRVMGLAAAAVVVVAALAVGTVVLTGRDDPEAGPADTSPPVTRSAPGPTDPPSPSPSETGGDPTVVVDDLNGITLPVLEGWGKAEFVIDDTILLTTPGTYDCPGDGSLCHHGTVASRTVTGSSSDDPKTVARKDVPKAADRAYDQNQLQQKPFKGIVSHEKVKEGAVAVAGRAGYMVRWRVKTKVGPGGYVESLVFRSSTGSESLVCVRFAFDAGSDGPPLSDMDKITQGIRPVDDAATGGGVGSSVGPSS